MAAQALSGIAKDLTKMSAKSAIKVVVPDGAEGALFQMGRSADRLKNALKGVGFFVGGVLLASLGFVGALGSWRARCCWCWLGQSISLPGRSRPVEKEGQIPFPFFQIAGHQLAFCGSPVPIRLPRCLVCGRASGISVGARMDIFAGRSVPCALDHRLWRHPGRRSGDPAKAR